MKLMIQLMNEGCTECMHYQEITNLEIVNVIANAVKKEGNNGGCREIKFGNETLFLTFNDEL